MSERFFIASPPAADRALLSGDEARHLVRVLRARVGDQVSLFDGSGVEWPARIVQITREAVDLHTGPPKVDRPSVGPSLTLAVALPKGDRQKWLVEKLVELGVSRLVPLETLRGVAQPTDAALTRLRRTVIEACKQCGRNSLMAIDAACTLADLLDQLRRAGNRRLLVADPLGPRLELPVAVTDAAEVVGLVGPEGGFTADEIALATEAGGLPIGLARHVLRVETAAITLAARLA
jgi:16S rRNA (uracil1498-N3)-methyltransferase